VTISGPIQANAKTANPNGLPMRIAAVYDRVIGASLARAWENVLDWEHLPHLHSSSFSSLELEEAGSWGWRALTKGIPEETSPETRIELVVDRENSRYVSRTVAGGLPGMEIWTHFSKLADRETQIRVEFHIPHVDEESAAKLGSIMTGLYDTLWDEDERMMVERQAALDGRSRSPAAEDTIDLGDADELCKKLPITVEIAGKSVNIVQIDGTLHAYAAECPHMLAPLEDVPVDDTGCITCPWHGYRFDIRSGQSTDGGILQLNPVYSISSNSSGQIALKVTEAKNL
jgi:nitrite reductase/ring-hydroxylating ferredoxin subunit